MGGPGSFFLVGQKLLKCVKHINSSKKSTNCIYANKNLGWGNCPTLPQWWPAHACADINIAIG